MHKERCESVAKKLTSLSFNDKKIFASACALLFFIIFFLFSSIASAKDPDVGALLKPSSKGLGLATATFHLSSGNATQIQKVTLTYFTSADCTSGPFIPAFSTPETSPALTIPGSGNFFRDATSTYQVAIHSTPGTTSGLQSVLMGLRNTNGTSAVFTGSCASTGGDCCLPITCDQGTQTCSSSVVGTQGFTLSTGAPNTTISTSSPLLIQPSTTGSLLITNTGATTATNIVATLPSTLSDVTQDSSGCTSVASGATCQLSFTSASNTYDPTLISIKGSNTNTVFATLSVGVPWAANGTIITMTQDLVNHLLYIGGSFGVIGPNTGNGVPLDTTSGEALATFPKVNGTVNAVIPDGSGGWYIGGLFTNVGGVAINNLAHILPNYTLDINFSHTFDKAVNALALSGSKLYVGGAFTVIDSSSRSYVAAFDTTNAGLLAWSPNADSTVNALLVSGSTVYVGGNFSNIGGQTRVCLAALDADSGNALSGWIANTNGTVNALALDGSLVYVGGTFSLVKGTIPRNRIAAVAAADATLSAWDPNIDNTVNAIAVSADTVYVGGIFTSVGGQPRNRIAAIDKNTAALTAWNPNCNSSINSLALSGSTVYAGGTYSNIGGASRSNFAALDINTGAATAWNPIAGSTVNALAVNGSTIYAGGSFATIGGVIRNRLAAIDTATGKPTSWDPNADNSVFALLLSDNIIYAGGQFTQIGGLSRNRLAAIRPGSGALTSWNPDVIGGSSVAVRALAASGSVLYIGGNFNKVGSATRNQLAAVNVSDGSVTSWDPNVTTLLGIPIVRSLLVSGSVIYVGGSFSIVASTPRNGLAAVSLSDGNVTSWDPNIAPVGSIVKDLAVRGSVIYVGGGFSNIGTNSAARSNLAAVDTSSGVATNWNPTPAPTGGTGLIISSFVFGDSLIYTGGTFTTPYNRLAAFDISTGALSSSWNPNANSNVNALAINGTTIYIAGAFSTLGDLPASRFTIMTQ